MKLEPQVNLGRIQEAINLGLPDPLAVPENLDLRFVHNFLNRCSAEPWPENTLGLHGTSLEAMRLTLITGKLPTGAVKDGITEGHVYFEVIAADQIEKAQIAILGDNLAHLLESPDEYKNYSEKMAAILARKHYALYALALDFQNPHHHQLALRIGNGLDYNIVKSEEYRDAVKELETLGHSEKKLFIITGVCQLLNGFCLGLVPQLLRDYRYTPDLREAEIPRVKVSEGVPLPYITQIKAMGELENQWLERLRKLSFKDRH